QTVCRSIQLRIGDSVFAHSNGDAIRHSTHDLLEPIRNRSFQFWPRDWNRFAGRLNNRIHIEIPKSRDARLVLSVLLGLSVGGPECAPICNKLPLEAPNPLPTS